MDFNNMDIFDHVKDVPDSAKKKITGGRMNGKTDISPMWRIQVLTEVFGPCGIGWWYEITDKRLERGAKDEVKCFVDINLFYVWGDHVSKPIPGTGGNTFVEAGGKYTSDECFKMALTDAISVAAKALGVGASVYAGGDDSKYTQRPDAGSQPPRQNDNPPPPPRPAPQGPPPQNPPQNVVSLPPTAPDGYWYCEDCKNIVGRIQKTDGTWMRPSEVVGLAMKRYNRCVCSSCMKKREAMRA